LTGIVFLAFFASPASSQVQLPPSLLQPAPSVTPAASSAPPSGPRVRPANPVPENEVAISATTQMKEGAWYRLRGNSVVQTDAYLLKADDIDYNEETGDVDASGHVYLQNFEGGEELWCERALYNINDDTGKFWEVRGQTPVHIEARPRVLTSTNPFYFEGKWAERLKEKYILHDGFITNCKMPKPWWIVRAPVFDIIPDERAVSHSTIFRLRRIPLFYTPYYYKSLKTMPRQSGFLMPNIGNSSTRGKMIGLGYYWAINRSYDASYHAQYFTSRGLAHTVDFRGKPIEGTDFSGYVFGIQDRGIEQGSGANKKIVKQGGFMTSVQAKTDLGHGFTGRAEVNYLSSFTFRQAFTETYNEAITSEVHSVGFITRQWDSYSLDFVGQRLENFQNANQDPVVIRKLPEVEFSSRDHRLWKNVPLWISWETSGGLLRRKEVEFQTRQYLERLDVHPRVTTVLRWKDFALVPSFAIRETHYGESREQFHIIGQNINRGAREADLELVLPSFARVFKAPKWLGDSVKHVIEPGASYRYVSGVDNFNNIILFDETELFSNTNQVEVWVTNRLYAKRKDDVSEVLSWDLRQQRYFDPTFGGAVTSNWCGQPTGCRNVVLSSIQLTPFAFLDGPRNYSPVASTLRASPITGLGVEWRSDYDPLYSKIVASTLSVDGRFGKYYVSAGHNTMRYSSPFLSPTANEFSGRVGIGNENRRGWNAGFMADYDYRAGQLRWARSELTYNTDCCGFSIQYQRIAFGIRNENQFRIAFAVANVGSFGTLKKQDKMF
jgi:LPS-assembly protein